MFLTAAPSITLRGKSYRLPGLTSTSYVRLTVLIKPLDGTPLSELILDKPEDLDPAQRSQALADRQKMSNAIAERLADDITTRRLAFALKSLCPELVTDGLVIYNHLIRPDDWIAADFDVLLEIEEILDTIALASNCLTERAKAKKALDAAAKALASSPTPGFQSPTPANKPKRRQ